jgi:hypothetical protein
MNKSSTVMTERVLCNSAELQVMDVSLCSASEHGHSSYNLGVNALYLMMIDQTNLHTNQGIAILILIPFHDTRTFAQYIQRCSQCGKANRLRSCLGVNWNVKVNVKSLMSIQARMFQGMWPNTKYTRLHYVDDGGLEAATPTREGARNATRRT